MKSKARVPAKIAKKNWYYVDCFQIVRYRNGFVFNILTILAAVIFQSNHDLCEVQWIFAYNFASN